MPPARSSASRFLLHLRRRLRADRCSWTHATLLLLLAGCLLLLAGAHWRPSNDARQEYMRGLADGQARAMQLTKLRVEAAAVEGVGAQAESVPRELYDEAQARLQELTFALQQAKSATPPPSLPEPSSLTVERAVYLPMPAPDADPNPLRLPPYLNARCQEPDVVALQRWIVARQHAYAETKEQLESGEHARNPDPDPYCQRSQLLVDTIPSYYSSSEADVLRDALRQARERGMAEGQRAAIPELDLTNLPSGRASRRQSGFGLAAQLHVVLARMVWAWRNGYTYVNLARSPWTKGMGPRGPYTGKGDAEEESAPLPFRNDDAYMRTNKPEAVDLSEGSCENGGWDCFFLAHTSAGCLARAKRVVRAAAHFPPLNDEHRARRAELLQRERVLLDPDLHEWMQQSQWTDLARVRAIEGRWKEHTEDEDDMRLRAQRGDLSALPADFDFGVDPRAEDWMEHSLNPWSLPGLSLQSRYSSNRGDLFLVSEALRFFARPAPSLRGQLRNLLLDMQFPGVNPRRAPASAFDDSDRATASQGVIAVHVRRSAEDPRASQRASRKGWEYAQLVRQLAPALGAGSVFLSCDDKRRYDVLMHHLGDGNTREPGLGLRVLHVPFERIGEGLGALPQPTQQHQGSSPLSALQRATSGGQVDSRAQAAQALSNLLDGEGATLLCSLLVMGRFSAALVGTVSSHWARVALEMQRWDDGNCAPPDAGWMLPRGARLDARLEDAAHKPAAQKHFVDLDGDAWFLGDFHMRQRLRAPRPVTATDLSYNG